MNRRSGIVLAAKSKEGHRPGQISLRRLRATSVAYNSGAASATPIAALSGANHKAPGFAGGYLLGAQSDWVSVASLLGSWSSLGDAAERPGASWAPGRITGRGHRRPRLYRPVKLSCHHWAVNIPGVWGQSPQVLVWFEVKSGPDSRRSVGPRPDLASSAPRRATTVLAGTGPSRRGVFPSRGRN